MTEEDLPKEHLSKIKECIDLEDLNSDVSIKFDSDALGEEIQKPSLLRPSKQDRTTKNNNTSNQSLEDDDLKLLEEGDKPLKGTLFFILYTMLNSLNFLFSSYLYRSNPDLTPL